MAEKKPTEFERHATINKEDYIRGLRNELRDAPEDLKAGIRAELKRVGGTTANTQTADASTAGQETA